MTKLLSLLEDDCTLTTAQLASMTNMTEEDVKAAVAQYEEQKIILGYKAMIDWDRTERNAVTALIEVKVTPQRGEGFDRIAERIYQYDEVESVYLMSGAFDLTVIISGHSLREIAEFVGQRLATLEDVTGTATHFILRKYKEKHLIFAKQEPQEREWIFV
ncbi:MAG: Lrp/AsnC family transcriptional regulator [Oscillospiraceae bacterium]|nr:Lrp/AsnC family transcriptional regulator [Oscillospiraceae bacterium]